MASGFSYESLVIERGEFFSATATLLHRECLFVPSNRAGIEEGRPIGFAERRKATILVTALLRTARATRRYSSRICERKGLRNAANSRTFARTCPIVGSIRYVSRMSDIPLRRVALREIPSGRKAETTFGCNDLGRAAKTCYESPHEAILHPFGSSESAMSRALFLFLYIYIYIYFQFSIFLMGNLATFHLIASSRLLEFRRARNKSIATRLDPVRVNC